MKENSLANRFPHLLEEWDWEKNITLGLDPYKLTYGSDKKVWWLCPKGHSYDAKIKSRTTMNHGCPFCAGRRACEDNCLATTHPHIAKEWHPEMNGKLTPKDVTAGSGKRVYWLCPKGHSYEAKIDNRTIKNHGCPYCSGKRVCEDNCLATTHPHIAKEWHPQMNGNLTPKDVTAGCNKRAYWLCPKGHSYDATINSRTTMNSGCPFCAGRRACGDNCLATTHPHIAKEWHPEMNGNLIPKDVTAGSEKRVYWLCPKGHSYDAKILKRTIRNQGCPYCSGQRACEDNCLATTHPHIAKEWHPEMNGNLTPKDVTAGSGKRVYWLCPKGHSYDATINSRTTMNSGCPFCAGRRACEDNCLATTHPHIAKEWHPEMNGKLTPKDVTAGSEKRVYWLCPKGHSYEAKILNRTSRNNTGCPKCNQSKGETRIKDFLERFEIQSKTQQTFHDCRNKKPLPFDFIIYHSDGTLALAIEYQGEQHYKPIKVFGGKEGLERIKKNDEIKRNYCKMNNIPLLEIKYTEFDRIEEILTEKLMELGLLKRQAS